MNASMLELELVRRDLNTHDEAVHHEPATRRTGDHHWEGWLYRGGTAAGPEDDGAGRNRYVDRGGRPAPRRRPRHRRARPRLVDITRAVRIVPWT
ncbi:hypothetical protein Athai_23870 [Actinocatenispora thailandica]|uniref:Uncharacterized protein n=1 Tax=Actinocatenispora thailandica TaxID=227318 RepID=A0A7R7DNA0_9ACTN|nr:hypothetical protein Athai_23870 [Actinocatenispora thailandica]